MKYRKILAVGAVVVLLAAGCNSTNTAQNTDGGQNNTQLPVAENTVEIKDYAFNPATIIVKKGTTITWINKDSARHNVVAQGGNASTGPKSELLAQDQSYTFTFNDAGTYEYLCEPHPYMKAKVIVE